MDPIELKARREALGLSQSLLAELMGNRQNTVSQWESGKRGIPDDVKSVLAHWEQVVVDLVDQMIELVDGDDYIGALITHETDDSLWREHPEMDGTPALIHRVACARVASELRAEGVEVMIVSKFP